MGQVRRDDFEEEDDIETYMRHMKEKGITVGKGGNYPVERDEVTPQVTWGVCGDTNDDEDANIRMPTLMTKSMQPLPPSTQVSTMTTTRTPLIYAVKSNHSPASITTRSNTPNSRNTFTRSTRTLLSSRTSASPPSARNSICASLALRLRSHAYPLPTLVLMTT